MFNTKSAGRWMNLRFFLLSYAFLPRKFQINLSTAAVSDSSDPVRVILPFKDQSSADTVRRQLQDLSLKIHTTVSPVFVSQKIERDLKMREAKLPLVNQQCVMFTNLNVTCAMQVMLVTHLATYTSELRNTKAQVHPRPSLSY